MRLHEITKRQVEIEVTDGHARDRGRGTSRGNRCPVSWEDNGESVVSWEPRTGNLWGRVHPGSEGAGDSEEMRTQNGRELQQGGV